MANSGSFLLDRWWTLSLISELRTKRGACKRDQEVAFRDMYKEREDWMGWVSADVSDTYGFIKHHAFLVEAGKDFTLVYWLETVLIVVVVDTFRDTLQHSWSRDSACNRMFHRWGFLQSVEHALFKSEVWSIQSDASWKRDSYWAAPPVSVVRRPYVMKYPWVSVGGEHGDTKVEAFRTIGKQPGKRCCLWLSGCSAWKLLELGENV